MHKSVDLKKASPLQSYWGEGQEARWESATLCLREVTGLSAIRVQAKPDTEVKAIVCENTGCVLSHAPNLVSGTDPSVLWFAPNDWLLVSEQAESELVSSIQSESLAEPLTVVLASSNYSVIEVSGVSAALLLGKGCGVDFDTKAFVPGQSARTGFAALDLLLVSTGDQLAYRLFVERGEAEYLWRWLLAAAREFS